MLCFVIVWTRLYGATYREGGDNPCRDNFRANGNCTRNELLHTHLAIYTITALQSRYTAHFTLYTHICLHHLSTIVMLHTSHCLHSATVTLHTSLV